ncbi:hypothetical protein QGN29_06960 [Temperatibacter marinus]|uniref:Uncharacterized protein n=1 Tax=Temperatibacter marinus TaxID=1456591 RepID=A0AA52EEN4_9PROT|nr:hypothetical protein [Temperatibacter marinus]WND04112.1 hypothetical protein QGN29_06960 [Temperatibacter marinus]
MGISRRSILDNGKKGGLIAALTLLTACMGQTEAPVAETVNSQVEEAPREAVPLLPKPVVRTIPKAITLLGKTPSDIFTLFGEPRLIRTEGSQYIMQYKTQKCVLDIVFAQETETDQHANHLSARNQMGEKLDLQLCFESLYP